MRERYSNTTLYDASFWSGENIDGPSFTKYFMEILGSGDFQLAKNQLHLIQNIGIPSGFEIRIRNIHSLIRDFELFAEEFIKDKTFFQQKLIPYKDRPLEININELTQDDFSSLPNGRYKSNLNDIKSSSFDNDFIGYDQNVIDKLKLYNFNEKISQTSSFDFRVMENVSIHGINKHFYSCAQDGVYFDEYNSSRLAKSAHLTFFKKTIKHIDSAIILPIPHASSNYYHAFAEMVYGLKHINLFNEKLPILYSEDKFLILKEIAKRLNIDLARFYSLNDICDSIVKHAYSILPSNFYWSKDFYDFFRPLGNQGIPAKKVYVSRKNSSRSLHNETEIEDALKKIGFDIVYSEKLSIEQQINLFSNVSILISSHGAGLTNIAFMKPNTVLIEIFEDLSIVSHFYLRSRHNSMKYAPAFAKEGILEIDYLLSIINKVST
jgi:hypothetical protein